MDSRKRKALQRAGWKTGDAADFLMMTDDERQLLEFRVNLALAIKQQRQAHHLSQKQLGERLRTSQPRVVKIEHADRDVSMDQMMRAFTAAGGKLSVTVAEGKSAKSGSSTRTQKGIVLTAAISEQ